MPRPEVSPYPIVSHASAQESIRSSIQSLPPEVIPCSLSLHRILAEQITSPTSHPPFRASIKDGYALKLPLPPAGSTLTISAETTAGETAATILDNHAVYVTTGAPVPDNADCVIMVENCIRDGNTLSIVEGTTARKGMDIREIGSDIAEGDLLLQPGAYITSGEIGLLLSVGITHISVYPKPVLGVFSTGNELVDIATFKPPLSPGKIIDSNRQMLLSIIAETLPFCTPCDLGIIKDDEETVQNAMEKGMSKCNILITSGGVSMGNKDLIKPTLAKLSTIHFGRVRIKPGKPLTFATTTPHNCQIGLPGNPVSAFVCFHLAVAPAARLLAGWDPMRAFGVYVDALLKNGVKRDAKRTEFHRVTMQSEDGKWTVESTGNQQSSRLKSVRAADGLMVVAEGDEVLDTGSTVRVMLLPSILH